MKINRLTIAGFGPYKTAQSIDFDEFAGDGIFLITGNTGAGKSSILDAICFALYAAVPRYEGTQQQLRSDYCEPGDPTYVELWFTTAGQQYRVRRSPDYEQPKKRGEGTTKRPASAELYVHSGDVHSGDVNSGELFSGEVRSDDLRSDDGEWRGIAAIPRDVGIALDTILGLSKDQFLQVILLAQNRFQKFLQAKNDERQAVLQSLFGTRRFADIERALVERRKALEGVQAESAAQIRELAAQVETLIEVPAHEPDAALDPGREPGHESDPDAGADRGADTSASDSGASAAVDREWFEAALAGLSDRVKESVARVAGADAVFDQADTAFRELENVRRLQICRNEASTRLAELELAHDAIERDRQDLDAASRAEIVWAHIAAVQSAELVLERARSNEEAARIAYANATVVGALSGVSASPTAAGHDVASPSTLAAEAGELSRLLGALDVVLADEQRIPDLARRITELDSRESTQQAALLEAADRAKALPIEVDTVVAQRGELLIAAAAHVEAEQRVERLVDAREAAVLSADLQQQVDEALQLEKAASTANAHAASTYDDMLQRRLGGHAAELAAKLVDGEPCAVCGSVTHPNPTQLSEDFGQPVTDSDLDAQREQLAAAAESLRQAGLAVQQVLALHAASVERSGRRSLDDLDADLASSRESAAAAKAASKAAADLEGGIARLRDELEATTARLAELREELESTQTARAGLRADLASISERVSEQRGQFDSVAARVHDLQFLLDATRSFEAALVARDEKQAACAQAHATLRSQLDEQRFADSDEVVTSRLAEPQRASVSARIKAHDIAWATATSTLAEAELRELPAELVELDEAAETRSAAREARDDARVSAASLSDRLTRLRGIVADALDRVEASAAVRAEYETLRSLANSVEGNEPNTMRMRLESYVLAAQLEEIISAANARLAVMTGGRYSLEHDDSVQYRNTRSGLGIAILDQHTGRARATHSLSGGETFLASLALALGLAEVVSNQAGGITLDTLFIDEGFGSLDADTLAVAMSTLDSLRAGGRTIGLISHVDAMKEQIPSRLRIVVTPQGYSEIEQRA